MPDTIGSSENLAKLSNEERERLLAESQNKEIELLAGDVDPHDEYDGSHKTTICFNKSCPDYKVQRHGNTPCSCKRTSVKGAGDARIGYSHY